MINRKCRLDVSRCPFAPYAVRRGLADRRWSVSEVKFAGRRKDEVSRRYKGARQRIKKKKCQAHMFLEEDKQVWVLSSRGLERPVCLGGREKEEKM